METIQNNQQITSAKKPRNDVPKLRFKEFEEEWEKTNILSITDKVTDGTHDTPKTSKKGNPYLTAIHVKRWLYRL